MGASKCRVEWNHKDDAEVGGSTVATVHVSWGCTIVSKAIYSHSGIASTFV